MTNHEGRAADAKAEDERKLGAGGHFIILLRFPRHLSPRGQAALGLS
jgi:hypothetical protein